MLERALMTKRAAARPRRWRNAAGSLFVLAALVGCFSPQVHHTVEVRVISLKPGDLEAHGIAFITPSAATGQEEEKQAVALIFANVLRQQRGRVRVVSLAEALNAINRNGMADAYKRMYDDYRDTGLLKRDVLEKLGRTTGARYIAQIKLQGWGQGAKERFGALGLRVVETHYASVRLFLQIWDSADGTIAWEGMQEFFYARDHVDETPVTFRTTVESTAEEVVRRLP
jgi:hypothetical protein